MARIIRDPTTGHTMMLNEDTGEWENYTPAESTLEALLVGTGAAFQDFGRGIRALSPLSSASRTDLELEQQAQDDLLRPLRAANPIATTVGDILPSLATLPLGGTAALAGRLTPAASAALSTGLGALEGGLRFNPSGQGVGALFGAAGGLGGEFVGRMAGRVTNAIRGAGSALRRSMQSEQLAERGLQALPSERLNVPGQDIGPLQRLEQGAQTGVLSPPVFREIAEERATELNIAAARAIGLDAGDVTDGLTPDVLAKASDQISEGFQDLAARSAAGGQRYTVDEGLAARVLNTRGQIKELTERGMFQGLVDGELTGPELLIARRALAQDATQAASRGQYELANAIFSDVDELDRTLAARLGPEAIGAHTRLREQYRNLQILSRSGVIGADGNVSARTLSNRMGQGTGYGAAYREGRGGTQPETGELMATTRLLADPVLQPFRTSGTAENQAVRATMNLAAQAASDPTAALGLVGEVAAPLMLRAAGGSNRAANIFGGLLMPGGPIAGRLGGEAGASLLEQMLLEQQRAQ